MKNKPIISLTLGALIISSIPAVAGTQRAIIKTSNGTITSVQSSSSESSQSSQTSLTVPSNNLILRVNTTTKIRGTIKLNDKVISQLGANTKIDLSPYLRVGLQTLTVNGTYNPFNESVTIDLQGPSTQVSLSNAGSGKINQTLILDVQGKQ